MEKWCNRCKQMRDVGEFHKDKNREDGLNPICKQCKTEYNKAYYSKQENIEKVKKYHIVWGKKYRQENKEIISKRKQAYEALPANRVKINQKRRERVENNIQFRIACGLRSRFRRALGQNYKNGSAVRDLGCSIEELKIYIANQFVDGMSWENWGNKDSDWHLDHIKPLHLFDLSIREEVIQACHYTNLRPLWRKDNLSRTYEELNDNFCPAITVR